MEIKKLKWQKSENIIGSSNISGIKSIVYSPDGTEYIEYIIEKTNNEDGKYTLWIYTIADPNEMIDCDSQKDAKETAQQDFENFIRHYVIK